MIVIMKKFIKPVQAHCDIPCGIYETDTLKNSAQTCLKMVATALELQKDPDKNLNNLVRTINNKEEHAQICKQQIYILWSDYFKANHFADYPELHRKLWLAAKQCSTVKQTVNLEEAEKLVSLTAEIDNIFQETR